MYAPVIDIGIMYAPVIAIGIMYAPVCNSCLVFFSSIIFAVFYSLLSIQLLYFIKGSSGLFKRLQTFYLKFNHQKKELPPLVRPELPDQCSSRIVESAFSIKSSQSLWMSKANLKHALYFTVLLLTAICTLNVFIFLHYAVRIQNQI